MDNEEIQRFLTDVTNQVAYKPLHGGIKKELEDHIEDRVEEYILDGNVENTAIHMAVSQMGDGSTLGVMMNEQHHVRVHQPLLWMTCCMVALGIGCQIAERTSDTWLLWDFLMYGLAPYIVGILILAAVFFKGYPWIVTYTKSTLCGILVLILAENTVFAPSLSFAFGETVVWGILVGLLAYRWRHSGLKLISGSLTLMGIITVVQYFS